MEGHAEPMALFVGVDVTDVPITASSLMPEDNPSARTALMKRPADLAALQEHLQATGPMPPSTWRRAKTGSRSPRSG